MEIKHSKYKNTGLIFELLIKQITADTLSKKDSPAIHIIKKFFTGDTALTREYKLYEFVLKNTNTSQKKAENILATITELSRKINQSSLKTLKYDLISEIKKSYDLNEFFKIQIKEYKPLAALYCLLEAQNTSNLIDPQFLVNNRMTLLEHLTSNSQSGDNTKDTLIEEYSKYDKDLRLLTFKILLEKFNDKYKDLLPEQKTILREFITSVNSTSRLRTVVNEELVKISEEASKLSKKVKDEILCIKLDEIVKNIKPIEKTEKITDSHLISLMQYYSLLHELRSV